MNFGITNKIPLQMGWLTYKKFLIIYKYLLGMSTSSTSVVDKPNWVDLKIE